MEQLIVNKPSDPLAFLVEQLKKENDDGIYILNLCTCVFLNLVAFTYIEQTDVHVFVYSLIS